MHSQIVLVNSTDLHSIKLLGHTGIIMMSYMQGYKHKKAFIVAEGPMQSTVRNFWKMIYDHNCAVVVMTSGLVEGGQESSTQYWPDRGIALYGEFIIDLLREEKLEGFTIRNLSVMDTRVHIPKSNKNLSNKIIIDPAVHH